jgi:DNA-binding FadR family transcriptional regulator
MRSRWPIGVVLGSESDLIERFGVSRSVLREAVRLLESRGVARMRSGPGGGLRVTAPEPAAVRDATRLFLDFSGVRANDLYQVWIALEVTAVAAVAESIDEDGVIRLRALLADEATVLASNPGAAIDVWVERGMNLHLEIARQAANPALELFLGVVVELAAEYHTDLADPAAAAHWLHDNHSQIVSAIVSGDGELAQLRLRRYMKGLMKGGGMGPVADEGLADGATALPGTRPRGNRAPRKPTRKRG